MKHKLLRRLGTLVLALALALSVAVVPAMAANPTSIRITQDGKVVRSFSCVVSSKGEPLVCIAQDGTEIDPLLLKWESSNSGVLYVNGGGYYRGVAAGTATLTVSLQSDPKVKTTCTVTVREPVPAAGVTLNQTALRLNPEDKVQLTATVSPANADDKTVTWTVAATPVGSVTVDDKGLVTANAEGSAIVTATASGGKAADGTDIKAECTVYVGPKPDAFTAEDANGSKGILSGHTLNLGWKKVGDAPQRVEVTADPNNAVFTYESVQWNVTDEENKADQSVIRVVKDPASFGSGGRTAVVTAVGPGRAKLCVASGEAKSWWTVEVPGITLRGNVKTITNGRLSLWEGETERLLVNYFGDAVNAGSVIWRSSDESIVSCYQGELKAQTPGTVKVTASLDGYPDAELTVTVQEDTSALVSAGSVTAGGSLNLNAVASQLSTIARNKTGSALSYITNLSVPTSQGIVHDTHRSEADTGAGVGASDRYYLSANTALGQSPLSDLSFVARNTYSGTADISYTGVTTDNQNFSGVIRVTVAATAE